MKRGPVGVIATTMNDAFETADTIIADIKSGQITTNNEMERNVWQEHIGENIYRILKSMFSDIEVTQSRLLYMARAR